MRKALAVISLFLVIIACSVDGNDAPTLEVGNTFSNSNVRVVSIDTFAVEMSTFKFDSLVSSETDRLLIGQYTDPVFGTVRCETFLEFTPTTLSIATEEGDEIQLDSVGLVLGYDNYFYGDTTNLATYNIHLIAEEFDSDSDDNFFYTTSRLEFESTPLTTFSYNPEPIDEDSLYIPLPIEFGQPIFDSIQGGDIGDQAEFLTDFLRGLTIQPAQTDNASIIGFSFNLSRTYLRFFYSEQEEFEDVELTYDIGIQQLSTNPSVFNRIVSDVTGNPLEVLVDQEISLASTESGDQSFIQAGIGYATRIQFPSIREIFNNYGDGGVLSATLEIKPNSDSFNDLLPIQDSLNINVLDRNNDIVRQIQFGLNPAFALIDRTEEQFKNLIYEVPIGVFVDEKLREEQIREESLVLFQNDYNQTVGRIVLEGENSSDFEARLIVTYAIYEDEENE